MPASRAFFIGKNPFNSDNVAITNVAGADLQRGVFGRCKYSLTDCEKAKRVKRMAFAFLSLFSNFSV